MKVGVSTFVMQGGTSGVAAYLRNLIRFLQLEDSENRYGLLMSRNDANLIELMNPNFPKIVYPPFIGKPVVNLAWHNTLLPQGKYDVLHIPSYHRIPLLKRTEVVATVHDLAAFAIDAKYDPARMLFTPCDFIAAITQHIPDKNFQLVRYYGWYSNKMRGQRNKQAESKEGESPDGEGTVELFPGDPFPDYSADPVMDYGLCANG